MVHPESRDDLRGEVSKFLDGGRPYRHNGKLEAEIVVVGMRGGKGHERAIPVREHGRWVVQRLDREVQVLPGLREGHRLGTDPEPTDRRTRPGKRGMQKGPPKPRALAGSVIEQAGSTGLLNLSCR